MTIVTDVGSPGLGGPATPAVLLDVCGWPELSLLLGDIGIELDATCPARYELTERTIRLGSSELASPASAATTIREALEYRYLGLADSSSTSPSIDSVHRAVAFVTAATYGATRLRADGVSGLDSIAHVGLFGLSEFDSLLAGTVRPPESLTLAELAVDMSGLTEGADRALVVELVANALPLAPTTELILSHGGDHRQRIDWASGMNAYGMPLQPTPWIASFSSCTASTPSISSYRAASSARRELLVSALHGRLRIAAAELASSTRALLKLVLGLGPDDHTSVVLTPSGTDAEYVALAVTLAGDDRPITTIVVAPDEVGSGTVRAAQGRTFGDLQPLGGVVPVGEPLGRHADRVLVRMVAVRDDCGDLRLVDEVDDEVEATIELAVAAGHRVVLHLVEGSKTGIRLPPSDSVSRWQARWSDELDVVVDAAQLRVDQSTSIAHLDQNRMVFVTGSKFYAGPPFAGAVMLPPLLARRLSSSGACDGLELDGFLDRHASPEDLHGLREVCSGGVNVGLLVRWAAALSEMQSFHSVSREIRDEILRAFTVRMLEVIDGHEGVRLVESPYTHPADVASLGLDELPTIFTFFVLDRCGRPLGVERARRLHRLMPTDVSGLLREPASIEDLVLAARRFQIGQPVAIEVADGTRLGALRLAVGAPTVSGIVFSHEYGQTWRDRLDHVVLDCTAALSKIDLIMRLVELDDPRDRSGRRG